MDWIMSSDYYLYKLMKVLMAIHFISSSSSSWYYIWPINIYTKVDRDLAGIKDDRG